MGSKSVVDALDRIAGIKNGGTAKGNYKYQEIANGSFEHVLAFNNDETIRLVTDSGPLHFSSEGTLTDLLHNEIPGSAVETPFPVREEDFPATILWPPEQQPPWTGPPLDHTDPAGRNVTEVGYSKQAYFFNNRRDALITVGPSLPKIAKLSGGRAQFWVGSIGVISQGTGEFKGVRGESVYIGSAFLPKWPDNPKEQIEILRKGFKARIGTYFKFVYTH